LSKTDDRVVVAVSVPEPAAATKGEKVKSVQQAQQAYRDSAGRAQTAWAAGVNSYNGDWAGRTTAQQAVMLQNVTQAISSGRWAQGIARVGTGGWKAQTQNKQANYGVGLNAGAPKFDTAIAKVMAAEAQIVSSLPPRGDVNQNINRAVSVMQQLHALKGQLGA
jgi:hypothetical protein